tara:strand:+ start:1344 stop:1799 length:456 start_codon:yes stop_codon:yes gene_type:complete
MYAIISKYRLGKAPTETNEALKFAEIFIERLDTEAHPDQFNELNVLLDEAKILMRELDLVYNHGIEELLGRYIDHGYVPSMIDDVNPWRSDIKMNELRKEFAEIYGKLAQAANLECRVYRSEQYLIETGEPWATRANLINREREVFEELAS